MFSDTVIQEMLLKQGIEFTDEQLNGLYRDLDDYISDREYDAYEDGKRDESWHHVCECDHT